MHNLFPGYDRGEQYQKAAEDLVDAVEPIAGFRPEDAIQAVSLVIAEYYKLEPAMEALQNLVSEAAFVRDKKYDSD